MRKSYLTSCFYFQILSYLLERVASYHLGILSHDSPTFEIFISLEEVCTCLLYQLTE